MMILRTRRFLRRSKLGEHFVFLHRHECHTESTGNLSRRAPLSILNVKFGQQVELRVAQRQTEAYQPPPKKPMKAFSGSGNRLGSPASELVGSSASAPAHQPSQGMPGGFGSSGQASAQAIVESGGLRLHVDESKPTTNVQVRLADGTKYVPVTVKLRVVTLTNARCTDWSQS